MNVLIFLAVLAVITTQVSSVPQQPGATARNQKNTRGCGSFEAVSVGDRIRNNPEPLEDMGGTAALYKSQSNLQLSTHICGAILISDRHLLTAAHCVVGRESSLSISLGRDNLDETPKNSDEEYGIQEVYRHDAYKTGQHDYNDIAILKTDRVVRYSKKVWPFCLPEGNPVYDDFFYAEITGWGQVNKTHKASVIQTAFLKLVERSRCEALWRKHHGDTTFQFSYQKGITQQLLCAGRKGVDACEGDSGGPMAYQDKDGIYTVIGVTVKGISLCPISPLLPGFYTNIGYYVNWIYEKTGIPRPLTSNNSPNLGLSPSRTNSVCPDGFFTSQDSSQCFKIFTDVPRSWNAANAKCAAEGLLTAKPSDSSVALLRKEILNSFGEVGWVWLGARFVGSAMVWQRDRTELSINSALWRPGEPGGDLGGCLRMPVFEWAVNLYPERPYYSDGCSEGHITLCEVDIDISSLRG